MIPVWNPPPKRHPNENRQGDQRASNGAAWLAWTLAFLLPTLAVPQSDAEQQREILLIAPEVGYEIDADERKQFALFPEIDGFVSAQVTRVAGVDRVEIIYEKEGRRLHLERPIDEAELEDLRGAVGTVGAEETRAAVPAEGKPSDGRLRLATHAIAYGLWLYGAGIPIVFDIDSDRGQVGAVMLSGGGSAALAISQTRRYARGGAHAKMLTTGSYAGIFYGLVPDLWADKSDDKRQALGLMVGVPAAAAGMHSLFRAGTVTHGEADLTFWGMALGAGYGVLIPYLLNADHLEQKTQDRVYLSGASVGIPVGGWLAWRIAHDKRLSQGRALTLRLGSTLGAYYAYTVLGMLVDVEESGHAKRNLSIVATGVPLGMVAAYRLTKDESYSTTRARLLGLGGLAGGLVGSGLIYILTTSEDYRSYLAASAIGSGLGVWLTHSSTRSSRTPVSSDPAMDVGTPRIAWEVASLPELVFSLMARRDQSDVAATQLVRARF